jgi:hypothetical protein
MDHSNRESNVGRPVCKGTDGAEESEMETGAVGTETGVGVSMAGGADGATGAIGDKVGEETGMAAGAAGSGLGSSASSFSDVL